MVFKASLLIGYLLLAWFQTNVFVNYYWYLIDRHLKTENGWFGVYQYKLQEYKGLYIQFLRENYNGFWVDLFTCPTCLAFWMSTIVGCFIGFNNIVVLPIFSLIVYYLMVWLSNKAS